MKNTNPNKAPAPKATKKLPAASMSVAIGAAGEWKASVDLTLARHGKEINDINNQRKYLMGSVVDLSKNMVDFTQIIDRRLDHANILAIIAFVVAAVSLGAAILAYSK